MKELLAGAFFALASFAEGLDGKWSAKVLAPQGEVDAVYEFKVADGKITGSVKARTGDGQITEGTISGDAVSFVIIAELHGQERKLKHTGKLAGDLLDLELDMGGGQLVPIKAKRVP